MPGSISSTQESPQIVTFVVSVGCLVLSLMLTFFGRANNAWIVLGNEKEEFQRGVRGLDCFKTYAPLEKISCLPWGYENKTEKFSAPFDHVYDASIVLKIAQYLAIVIIVSQFFWLSYTVGLCCSLKFCQKVAIHKLILFHIMVTFVGLWIILFFLILFTDSILPPAMKSSSLDYSIGSGCWIFFLGGVIPYIIAIYCLFQEEMGKSTSRLGEIVRRRQQVPTTEIPLARNPGI